MSGTAIPPGVTVFCDPTLVPAMRGVDAISKRHLGVPLGILSAPAPSMLAQIQRHTRNDVLFTLSRYMDQAEQLMLVKPKTRVNGWTNPLVLTALADRTSAPPNRAALLALLGAARIAVTDNTVADTLDGRAVLASNGLAQAAGNRVMGAANTADVAFLVTTGAADIGLVYLTDVRADPRLLVLAPITADPSLTSYSGAVNAAAVSPNAGNVLNLLHSAATAAHFKQRRPAGSGMKAKIHPSTHDIQEHSLLVRIAHWLQALAIVVMIGSGWRIYNSTPIFNFRFPLWATLGGNPMQSKIFHMDPGVANALNWHFTGMWLLAASYLLFILNGIITGHFWRHLLPLRPRDFLRDFIAAATFRLPHRLGEYNNVQRAFYWGVLFAILMMILTGLAIWKPVQLSWLTWLFGGYPTARVLHFLFMAAICLFMLVHVMLVILVPKTMLAMVFGRAADPIHHGEEPQRAAE